MQLDLHHSKLVQSSSLNKRTVFDLDFFDISTSINFETDLKQEALYKFWKKSWEKSFTDLGYKEKQQLYSDDFYSKRVLTFFDQEEPVGCIFLESYNLSIESHRNSRYLQNFPVKMITYLLENGFKKAHAMSNLVINPEWRKSKTDLHLSQLLTSIGVWKACQDRGDVLLSCTRNDKKVNSVFKNHNSRTYCTDQRYNCDVDFIYIDLKTANIFPSKDLMNACLHFTAGRPLHITESSFL